jgi:hypothetical protein
MTIQITWAGLGHLFLSLLCLFGVLLGVLLWVWEFDERFPQPVRILGLCIGVGSIGAAVGIWFL